jgi:hypothetical protein
MADFDISLYERIVGKTYVSRTLTPVLVFNGESYTRYDLGAIGITTTKSARTLDAALRRMSITQPQQLARRVHELPTLKGVGVGVFASALALLKAHGTPTVAAAVSTWDAEATRIPKKDSDVRVPVTFETIKRRSKQKKGRKKQWP